MSIISTPAAAATAARPSRRVRSSTAARRSRRQTRYLPRRVPLPQRRHAPLVRTAGKAGGDQGRARRHRVPPQHHRASRHARRHRRREPVGDGIRRRRRDLHGRHHLFRPRWHHHHLEPRRGAPVRLCGDRGRGPEPGDHLSAGLGDTGRRVHRRGRCPGAEELRGRARRQGRHRDEHLGFSRPDPRLDRRDHRHFQHSPRYHREEAGRSPPAVHPARVDPPHQEHDRGGFGHRATDGEPLEFAGGFPRELRRAPARAGGIERTAGRLAVGRGAAGRIWRRASLPPSPNSTQTGSRCPALPST